MDTGALLSLIITFIVLVVFIGVIYYRYKNSPKEEDKEAAKKFLDGLKDNIYNMMLGIIRDFKYDEYDNLNDIQSEILIRINNMCEQYIEQELEKSSDILSVLALKALKTGMIPKYIDDIISSFNIEGTIEVHTNAIFQANLDESEKEDEKLQEEYSDETKYYAEEETNIESLEKVNEEELEKEEEEHKDELNPVRDEEESYNPEDISMEILDDDQTGDEDNDIYYDAKGRARSKKTGKYVKIINKL